MDTDKKTLFILIAIIGLASTVFMYFNMVYWADIIAEHTNYFVSLFVLPMSISITLGFLASIILPAAKGNIKYKYMAIFAPSLLPLVLLIYAVIIMGLPH